MATIARVRVKNNCGIFGSVKATDIEHGVVREGAWVSLSTPAQSGGGGISAILGASWKPVDEQKEAS